jgi:hypothetical protein
MSCCHVVGRSIHYGSLLLTSIRKLQLSLINSILSTLTQYHSEESYGSSLLHMLFCTPRQHSTAVLTVTLCVNLNTATYSDLSCSPVAH